MWLRGAIWPRHRKRLHLQFRLLVLASLLLADIRLSCVDDSNAPSQQSCREPRDRTMHRRRRWTHHSKGCRPRRLPTPTGNTNKRSRGHTNCLACAFNKTHSNRETDTDRRQDNPCTFPCARAMTLRVNVSASPILLPTRSLADLTITSPLLSRRSALSTCP